MNSIRIDLHIHTRYSLDSSITPKTLVDQLHAHPSIKAIAVTDHNTLEGYRKVSELASAYSDILVMPGVEVTTPLGDLVILGVDEMPPKPWNVDAVISFAKKRNGVVVVPHPYRDFGLGNSTKDFQVDAIETLNGNAPHRINELAVKLALEMKWPGVAGSDAHSIDGLWTVFNEVQAPMNADRILDAIKKGLVRVFSTGKSIHF